MDRPLKPIGRVCDTSSFMPEMFLHFRCLNDLVVGEQEKNQCLVHASHVTRFTRYTPHTLPPLFMRPPRFSGQRCSCRLVPGLEGFSIALLVSRSDGTRQSEPTP